MKWVSESHTCNYGGSFMSYQDKYICIHVCKALREEWHWEGRIASVAAEGVSAGNKRVWERGESIPVNSFSRMGEGSTASLRAPFMAGSLERRILQWLRGASSKSLLF